MLDTTLSLLEQKKQLPQLVSRQLWNTHPEDAYTQTLKRLKNNTKIYLSIIIPFYNVEKYIQQCLEQIYNNHIQFGYEVICISDGSTDSSEEIIQQYKDKLNIIILHQKHQNAGVARNYGLRKAHGEYVHFVDADDFVENNLYEIFYQYYDQFEMLIFNYYKFDNITKLKTHTKIFSNEKYIFQKNYDYIHALRFLVAPWNKIYKKSYLLKHNIQFDSLNIANDRSFYFKSLYYHPQIIYLPDILINYRVNNTSSLTSQKHRLKNFRNTFQAFDVVKDLYFSNLDAYETLLEMFMKDIHYFYHQYHQEKYIIRLFNQYIRNNLQYFLNSPNMRMKEIYIFYTFAYLYHKHVIPIIFSVDNNYAKYLSVSLISLIKTANKNLNYVIYILYKDLDETNIKLLSQLEIKNFKIFFINITSRFSNKQLYQRAHYSLAMYYRIIAPRLFNFFDKMIYIDCDTIICRDISELYQINLDNHIIGGCLNILNINMQKYTQNVLKVHNYINSGILVFNNKEWIKNDIENQCMQILAQSSQKYVCPDQDLINLACQNRILMMDLQWNYAWQFQVEHQETDLHNKQLVDELYQKKPYIIHYTSGIKPWNVQKDLNDLTKIWWHYAKASPFYHDILKNYKKIHSIQQ